MIARLTCRVCDRDDWDSLIPNADGTFQVDPTVKEMRTAATRAGWRDIERWAYPSVSIFDWQTHIGVCPECVDDWFGVPKDASLFAATTEPPSAP